MRPQSQLLPMGFEALTPFIEFWAAPTAAARAQCRQQSSEADRQAFYAAAKPLLPAALDYLDQKAFEDFDESEKCLMNLMLSFAHVTMAVELLGDEEPQHARHRHFMQITRAPADLSPRGQSR